jgi:hypothetical protein
MGEVTGPAEPAYFGVKYGDEPEFMEWKVGDDCLIYWQGEWRPFRIRTAGTQAVQLYATFKKPGERILPRTIRNYDKLEPIPRPHQTENKMTPLKIVIASILFLSIVGLVVFTLWPHHKGK